MLHENHDLFHELPKHKETILKLKASNEEFARLFDQYHEMDQEVHQIEVGEENTSDEYLNDRKRRRLALKDALVHMIHEA